MMKKIWFGVLFALFGGMVLSAQPAKAGVVSWAKAFWDRLGNMEASLLTDIPGMSSIICWFGDCDPEIFKQEIEKANDESKLAMLNETILLGGCAALKKVYAAKEKIPGLGEGLSDEELSNLCDEITRAYDEQRGLKHLFPRTLDEYLDDYRDACWFCNIFVKMYDAVNRMVTHIFNRLAKSFLGLMGVGILFLILFKVGRLLVQFQEVDVMQFLNDLFKPLGRAIIATALLGALVAVNTQTVFYLVTNPVIDVSLKLGEKVLDTTLGNVLELHQQNRTGTRADRIITESLNPQWNEIDSKYEEENRTPPDTALGEATRDMLVQWMKSVSSSFIVGIAMGGTFIKIGIMFFFTGGFSIFLSGIVIWLGFWILYLTFPFKIIDAFVRMAFVLTLMPLWIVLWVFPVTQQYTKRAFEMLLSSCFLFITLSIMIAIVLMLINHVVPEMLYNDKGVPATRSEFYGYLLDGYNDKASSFVSIGCGMIMNAIAFTAMGGSLLAAASTIANSFIGGGGNIQTNIGNGVAASAARVGGVGVSAGKAVGKWTWLGGAKLWDIGKKMKDSYQSRRAANRGVFPGDTGGGSGGGSGGGGGGNPPPGGGSGAIHGPRGEKGDTGPQGKTGRPGENATGSHDDTGSGRDNRHETTTASMPQQMQTEAANRATNRESELYDNRENPTAKNALLASAGARERQALTDMDQAMQRGERNMTPYRQALKEGILADMRSSIAGRAGVSEGFVDQALARENELRGLRGNPTAKNALLASVGSRERQALAGLEQAILRGEDLNPHREALAAAIAYDANNSTLPNPLADVSPERMRAVEKLAQDEKSVGNLRGLAQDMAFIEQSMSLNEGEFKQAMERHWQGETEKDESYVRKMRSYAQDVYEHQDKIDTVEDRTRTLLHDTYLWPTATRDTAEVFAKKMAHSIKSGNADKAISNALNELADQVKEAQAGKLTKES